MTIDERLENLAERHAALTQSVELLLIETREMRATQEAAEAAREKAGKQTDERIRMITTAIELDAENIRALARIAESHERRLTDIEGE